VVTDEPRNVNVIIFFLLFCIQPRENIANNCQIANKYQLSSTYCIRSCTIATFEVFFEALGSYDEFKVTISFISVSIYIIPNARRLLVLGGGKGQVVRVKMA